MKLRWLAGFAILGVVPAAQAGGLYLPGSGAVSTSRAGAAVASTDDGEALSINPAGLAKSKGTTITISMALINYAMEFTRRGTYDDLSAEALPYEGTPYPTVRNDPDLALGFGGFQPVPVFAISSDLGGKVPNLRVAVGLYAPNAYPFRELCTVGANGCRKYVFNGDFNEAPNPARYDITKQEAAVILPSIAASYRILPELDIGARFSAGFAHLKSTVTIWGNPANTVEYVKEDALFSVDAKDSFVPAFGAGVTYRPAPAIEIGAAYNSAVSISAKGDATSETGPNVGLNGMPITIGPSDGEPRCAPGGTVQKQKVCVELDLPMTATLGGRYKFLDAEGKQRGDVELNVGWENWSAERASNYRVVADAQIYLNGTPNLGIKDNLIMHGFKDVFTARVGGSYDIPQGENVIQLRGGLGYDTAAAKTGWLRADVDGASRTTMTLGAGYKAKRWKVDIGGGLILDGEATNPGNCNPVVKDRAMLGCNGDGVENPVGSDERQGPDPINPIVVPDAQIEAPTNKGTFNGHYILFMLGFSTWF
ncbi:MAG: outer membrane protein transport protein [Deltaproteobacteria bacterium]|nr:outer membrane protein transport protein [Deltaproteobacteria bacterium]